MYIRGRNYDSVTENMQYTAAFTCISCREPTRATKSCCRQSLMISVINYSGRPSELNIADQRQSSLSHPERHVHLSRPKLAARSTIGMPWQNFLSTVKSSWISLKHRDELVEKSFHAKNQINPFISFDRTPSCDRHRQTDRKKDMGP